MKICQRDRDTKAVQAVCVKKALLCLLPAVIVTGCVTPEKMPQRAPQADVRVAGIVPSPFKVGERLIYDVYYGLILAGTATIVVEGVEEICARPTYHIVLTAMTLPTFSKIFRVNDIVETWLDTEKLVPWKFAKSLREGDYEHDEVSILNQHNHLGHYRSLRSGSTKDYQLPEGCQDTLSILYFLRFLPYSVGDTFSLKVMADEKIWDVTVQVKERVKRTIYRGASYDTFHLLPDVNFDAGALRKGKGRIWITADHRRLIVLVKTKLPFGYLTFALVKADNVLEDRKQQEEEILTATPN